MSTATAAAETTYDYTPLNDRPLARPLFSSLIIIGCDLTTLTFVIASAVMLRHLLNGRYELTVYLRLWPLLGLFVVAYGCFGLYPGIAITPVSEIRKTTEATTLVFLVLVSSTFVMRDALTYSRTVSLVAWLGIMLFVPLARACVRRQACRRNWWGYPVVIFGCGRMAETVVRRLQQHPEHGLRPFAVLGATRAIDNISGVPVVGGFERSPMFVRMGISHALIAACDMPYKEFAETLELEANIFPHIIVVPEMPGIPSLHIETREVDRMLTLQIRNNLLLRGPQTTKRLVDIFSSIVGGLLLLPLGMLISLAIRIDSPGPATYAQSRVGRRGKRFRIWKFRTMGERSDALLFKYLQTHPAEREEWKRNHKLKDDPRITRVGRILRRTSLDELPQLWNVLRGDMSLVGPRPIVDAEIPKYGKDFLLYSQVTPGLTGMWQVSGRNQTTYEDRVQLDSYYVRNWSTWLDIYVLSRTFLIVLTGEGAY